MSDATLDELVGLFDRYDSIVDEIALFSHDTHAPLPLAEFERRTERLARVMPRLRNDHRTVGINLLATTGHHEENLPGSLDEPWNPVHDPCPSSCP
ncbi:MAG: hypothetical protein CMJ18_17670 [Phycisphaeraceae bacterium]|nr:hypothetical protein [Phycisphaeraceae bacterium]